MQTKFRNLRETIAKHFEVKINDPRVIACAEEITGKTPDIVAQANAKVDAILQMSAVSASKSWTLLPEIFQPHAQAFCEATTLKYKKQFASDWMATISDWMGDGYTPEMVTEAVRAICADEYSTTISRPGSITYKLIDLKVKQANPRQQTAKSNNPARESNESIVARLAASYGR